MRAADYPLSPSATAFQAMSPTSTNAHANTGIRSSGIFGSMRSIFGRTDERLPVTIPSPSEGTSTFHAMPPTPNAGGARARALAHRVLDMHAISALASRQSQTSEGHTPPQSPRGPGPECVVSVSGHGVGLIAGRLRRWNPLTQTWDASSATNIQRIKLGANNSQMWAMDADNRVSRVMPDTGELHTEGAVRLPPGTTDFTVSYMGRISFIEDGRVKLMQADAAAALSLTPPAHLGRAKSLSRAGNGVLHVLSESNELWQVSTRRPAGGDVSITGAEAQPEYWQRLTSNAFTAHPLHKPQPVLDRLQTLPDGGLGAMGAKGLQRFDPASGTWTRTELTADREMDRFYNQFRTEPNDRWESTGLGLLYPNPSSLAEQEGWSLSWLMKSIADKRKGLSAHIGLPASTAGVAGAGDFQKMQAAMRSDFARMSDSKRAESARLHELHTTARDWCASINVMMHGGSGDTAVPAPGSVDYNTAKALEALEKKGADSSWDTTRPWRVLNPDNNVLQVLLMVRWEVLGRPGVDGSGGDPISRRIVKLLNDGWYLPIDAMDDAFLVPVGKMLHDHALMMQAVNETADVRKPMSELARRMLGVSEAQNVGKLGHDQAAWSERIDGGPGNTVSMLFHRGVVDANRYAQLNDASVQINAGMRDASHKLLRAMTGPDGSEAGADKLVAFVGSMRPDKETISLKFGQNGGMDLGGLSLLFNLSDRSKTGVGPFGPSAIPLNSIPVLQALGHLAHASEITLDISRTETGIKVVIGQSGETSGSVGVAAIWGVGAHTNGDITASGVVGGELGVKGRASNSARQSVALEFTRDDEGKVDQVLHDLFSGQASLETLLERADLVTSSDGETRKRGGELYALLHAFARGNLGEQSPASENASGSRLQLMPMRDQLSLNRESVSSRTGSQGSDGSRDVAQRESADSKLNFNHFTLADGQYVHQMPLAADAKGQLLEIVPKLPLVLSVLSKPLWSTQVSDLGTKVSFAADGSMTVTATFATMGAPIRKLAGTDMPLTVANFPQLAALIAALPDVQPYLDKFNQNPELRATVTMEFTPAALAKVRAGLPQAPTEEQLAAVIKELMQDPENLCITDISAKQSNTFETKASFSFGPGRFISNASNGLSRKVAELTIAYDADGTATGFKVGGKELLDRFATPDIAELRKLERLRP
jgi:hypothetical protein